MAKNKSTSYWQDRKNKKQKNEESLLQDVKENNTIIYKTTSKLRLREGASLEKDVITILPKGAEVLYNGFHIDNWYYVKYNNYTGFCCKDYLE